MTEEQRILKVLLINDDKTKQQRVAESLAASDVDYQIVVLDDLDLVRKHLEISNVDLVISDIEIKGRETFDVMEIYQHLPWIVISTVKDHQILRKAFNSGAAEYIVDDDQNTDMSGLHRTIPEILERWNNRMDFIREEQNSFPENQIPASELHRANMRLAEESHQRLKVMDELRESREMYRRFFQTSRDAVFITSVDGRWIDMNRSALALFGYETREDIWTDTMLNFYWDSDQGRDYTRKLETDGFVNDHPMKFRKRDGSRISALVTAMPYEIGGKVIGYQGLIRDMTDELKAKDENIKLHKDQGILDSLAREMGNMLELNDIYTSISNHIKEMIVPDWIRVLKFDEIQNTFKIEYEWGMNPLGGEGTQELENFDVNYQSLIQETSRTKQTTIAGLDESLYQDHKDFQVSVINPGGVEGSEQNLHDYQPIVLTPILINDQVIGIIHVVFDIKKPPDKEDLSFLTRAANIVAISLKKAYLFHQSEAHVIKLSSLQRVQQIVLENLSLPTTLDMMVEQVVKELAVDAVNIQYLHPGLKSLRIIAQTGFRQKVFRDTGQEIGDGLAGRVAQTKSIVQIRDLNNCPDQVNRSLEFSTEKFVSYYGIPLLVKNRLVGVLEILNRSVMNPDANWMDLLKLIAGLVAVAIDLQNLTNDLERSNKKIAEAFDGVIMGWATALELRGIEPEGHAIRTQDLTSRLAIKMGISGTELNDIRQGALLHDIGKMGIPDDVLLKGSVLNAEERKLIGRHPIDAYELLKSVDGLKGVLDIPLYHHERWDGEGYPYGIAGEEIPLSARIFALVDVWDAMQTDRPYRKAYSRTEALSHLKEQAGKHFDPTVVSAFLSIIEEDLQEEEGTNQQPAEKEDIFSPV
jgi:PAS domain S-box-containing protein